MNKFALSSMPPSRSTQRAISGGLCWLAAVDGRAISPSSRASPWVDLQFE